MRKSIAAFFAAALSALGMHAVQAQTPASSGAAYAVKPGDLIAQKDANGTWTAIKILAVDVWPDGTAAAHCLTYQATPAKPTALSLKNTAVRIWHAPIAAASFRNGWEHIGSEPPSKEELVGFIEYLRLTDFPRYVAATGQDATEIVRKANEHYKRANALGEQGKRQESIVEYGKAIDLFPLFYEAIDNRAFTYMELGRFKEALRDFEESLRVNPNGVTAFFSKGECLMKLGQLNEAELVFQSGVSRFPEQRRMFVDFLNRVRSLQRGG